jgi:hypothetical protein
LKKSRRLRRFSRILATETIRGWAAALGIRSSGLGSAGICTDVGHHAASPRRHELAAISFDQQRNRRLRSTKLARQGARINFGENAWRAQSAVALSAKIESAQAFAIVLQSGLAGLLASSLSHVAGRPRAGIARTSI